MLRRDRDVAQEFVSTAFVSRCDDTLSINDQPLLALNPIDRTGCRVQHVAAVVGQHGVDSFSRKRRERRSQIATIIAPGNPSSHVSPPGRNDGSGAYERV